MTDTKMCHCVRKHKQLFGCSCFVLYAIVITIYTDSRSVLFIVSYIQVLFVVRVYRSAPGIPWYILCFSAAVLVYRVRV